MTTAVVQTEYGAFAVDLETEEIEPSEESPPAKTFTAELPRVVVPQGRAVAIADDDPDLIVYCSRNRLHVSTDGGVFWQSLAVELPEIEAVSLMP